MAALENVLVWADRVLLPAISSEGFVCVFVLFCFLMVCLFLAVFIFYCIAWQKSNDSGTFSVLTIEKFQIVHRTFNRRLFSKCMLTWGMYDAKIKTTRKDNLLVILISSLLSSHHFTLCRVIH